MQRKTGFYGQAVNGARARRRWAAAAAIALFSLAPLSTALAQTVSSFTQAQADRGKKGYDSYCAACHGTTLGGGGEFPALVGEAFRQNWLKGSPEKLMTFISGNMPQQDPGSLDPQTYADIGAYLMSRNRLPVGAAELPKDSAAWAGIALPPSP